MHHRVFWQHMPKLSGPPGQQQCTTRYASALLHLPQSTNWTAAVHHHCTPLTVYSIDLQLTTLEEAQARQSRGAREGAGVAHGDLESALSRLKADIWTEERSEVGHWCRPQVWAPAVHGSAWLSQGRNMATKLCWVACASSAMAPCCLTQPGGACFGGNSYRDPVCFPRSLPHSSKFCSRSSTIQAGIPLETPYHWHPEVARPARCCLGRCTA